MPCYVPSIHGPSDLYPRVLKDLSAQLLPRLRLIPEFRCWLPSTSGTESGIWSSLETRLSPTSILWHCLSQGSPLLILLDLLGSKTGGSSLFFQRDENADTRSVNAVYISEFLRRVEILEAQRQLSYGEVFQAEEFLNGSCSGFVKVLKTVQRVLNCLEATYPNLYELPNSNGHQKEDLFEHIVKVQTLYLEDLNDITECVKAIETCVTTKPLALEYFAVHIERMVLYQEYIIKVLDTAVDYMYILGSGAYRSYCSQFYDLVDFIDALCFGDEENEALRARCFDLSQQLTFPVDHFFSFIDTCSAALEVTHPIENLSNFRALCSTYQTLLNLKDDLFEVMQSNRTTYAKCCITNRMLHARLDTEYPSLGEFVIDDCLRAELRNISPPTSSHNAEKTVLNAEKPNIVPQKEDIGVCVYSFLFERMLFIGRPSVEEESSAFPHHNLRSCFPGGQWSLGPAIRGGSSFDVLCAIALTDIVHVERPDVEGLAINMTWSGREDGPTNTLVLTFYDRKQLAQWIRILSHLAPTDSVLVDITDSDACTSIPPDSLNTLSWLDEIEYNRRDMGSKARPWSLIARKEGSLASSLYLFSLSNASEPSLFSALSTPRSGVHRSERGLSASPRSISPVRSHRSGGLIANPLKLSDAIHSIQAVLHDSDDPPDLTGQIRRIGNYPAAHGGFSDVWKCNWITGPQCHKVAVKVIRGKLLNAEKEDKMAKRLQHEIKVWKRLEHENILPLHGTCSDFGRYLSLVCPWYENGSLYHYVRKNDGALKLPERLKLLSEIAAGLAYLHSCAIVHGDLSSANILINDDGQACLCDFGLSTLVEDLIDSWYPSSMLGGAIRWSAPELYGVVSCCDHVEASGPRVSMSSDIYSYGSIALEILSGKVPYYYLKHDGQVLIELSKRVKPQRTPSPFLTNDLWDFIRECWNDNPSARPSTVCVSSEIRLIHQRTLARHSI